MRWHGGRCGKVMLSRRTQGGAMRCKPCKPSRFTVGCRTRADAMEDLEGAHAPIMRDDAAGRGI